MSQSKERLLQLSQQLSGSSPAGVEKAEAATQVKQHKHGRLHGKVCIITGAGSELGIGRTSAWAFAENGAKAVYVTDLRYDLLPQLANDIQMKYPDVTVIPKQVDAASEDAVKLVIQDALNQFGRLDVFFANAGIPTGNLLDDAEASTFMECLRINTLSVFLALKHASGAMKQHGGTSGKEKSGGSIIATASVAGLRSGAGGIDYSASKAAVINLVQTGACHLANTNIRANAICPGLIETNITKPLLDLARSRDMLHKVGQLCPLQRYGESHEIANVAVFLASDESSYLNGQAIPVDGGLSSTLPIVPNRWLGI